MPPDHLQRQPEPRSAWRTLAHSFAPRGSRGQIITGLLCALLGFALVVQVKANRSEGLSSLRQDELGSIPGGALAAVRNAGGSTDLSSRDEVQVTAVRVVERPRYATPAPAIDGG